ncbi:MAG: pyruvate dehydrogenase complex E1 component subunit beta [Leptospirillia bacterium]
MDRTLLRTILEDMILARTFEERAAMEYSRGRIGGFVHLYPGEEAIATGVIRAAEPGDYLVTTYREHVHALVRGIPPERIMAELFGKATGTSQGMGGSMHLFDRERRFMGGYGIVGETFPVAIGLAYAIACRRLPEAVICFFGDGAVNQGTFHESLNMAALWNLPVLFVCENNLYQIGTEIRRHSAVTDVYRRASAYHIPGHQLDGMDVLAIHTAAGEALATIRSGGGPVLLECLTYRYRGHSMADPGTYRPAQEIAAWRARDPLTPLLESSPAPPQSFSPDALARFSAHCLECGAVGEPTLQSIHEDVKSRVEAAVAFAETSPEPTMERLLEISGLQSPPLPEGKLSASPSSLMTWQAINRAIDEEMGRDDSVFVMGEDVALFGGTYRTTEGLLAKYGEWRVRDTPISENSFTGLGVGAAMAGMRPIVEIMTVNFAFMAFDSLINLAPKIRLMSGGQIPVPLVVRMPGGVAHQLGAQHSQRIDALLMNVPGLRIVAPSTPQDAYSQTLMAIRSDDPVIVLEHERLYFDSGPVDPSWLPPMDRALVRREGSDISVIAWSRMAVLSLEAAEILAKEGLDVEVIDLRSLSPIDWETLVASVEKNHRALVVEENCLVAGAGAEIAATLAERCFPLLDAPVRRLGGLFVSTPFNRTLEDQTIPDTAAIVALLRTMVSGS